MLKTLLLQSDEQGLNPAHIVFQSGNIRAIEIYFNSLIKLVEQEQLSAEDFTKLLLAVTKKGYTILHQVCQAGDAENLKKLFSYFDFARQQLAVVRNHHVKEQHHCLEQRFLSIFTAQSKGGFTPAHDLLRSADSACVALYFVYFEQLVEQGLLTQKGYLEVLTGLNKKGYSPLHQACLTHKLNIAPYFSTLRRAIKKYGLTKEQFKQLFMNVIENANDRYTPLYDLLKFGDLKKVLAFFDELKQAVREGLLSKEELAELLLNAIRQAIPLQGILQFQNSENINHFFKLLSEFIDSAQLNAVYVSLLLVNNKPEATLNVLLAANKTDNISACFSLIKRLFP